MEPVVDPEVLQRSVLFAGLPPALLRAVLTGAGVATLSRGQVLWSTGDDADRVAMVLSGRLKAVRQSRGREVMVDIAMPGDVLGDVAFALREPHQSQVVCLRRARVLLLPADALRRAFVSDPRSLTSALFSLARRVQRLTVLVESLSSGKVDRRLAAVLDNLTDRAGEPFPGGVLVPVRLRRAELAALAATSAESVSRNLVAWERRGILTVLPAGYLVRDRDALRRVAANGRSG